MIYDKNMKLQIKDLFISKMIYIGMNPLYAKTATIQSKGVFLNDCFGCDFKDSGILFQILGPNLLKDRFCCLVCG